MRGDKKKASKEGSQFKRGDTLSSSMADAGKAEENWIYDDDDDMTTVGSSNALLQRLPQKMRITRQTLLLYFAEKIQFIRTMTDSTTGLKDEYMASHDNDYTVIVAPC